jgi:hypothetical protein
VLQDRMNTVERDLDQATAENLRLKGLTFDLDFKIAHYSAVAEQSRKRIRFFTDKQAKLVKDLEQAT